MHFKLASISSVLTKSTVNATDSLEMLLTGPMTAKRGRSCKNKQKTCKFLVFFYKMVQKSPNDAFLMTKFILNLLLLNLY